MSNVGAVWANAVESLLANCTVAVLANGEFQGSGFFVAPGEVLTSAHSVQGREDISIKYQNATYHASVAEWLPRHGDQVTQGYVPYPLPDVALLSVDEPPWGHPCVLLDQFEPEIGEQADEFYLAAYAKGEHVSDTISLTGLRLEFDSPHVEQDVPLLKLRGGKVIHGYSGGPLLNERSLGVCAIIESTRGSGQALGGFGVPVKAFISELDGLQSRNNDFHIKDQRWSDATARRLAAPLMKRGLVVWTPEDFASAHTRIGSKYDALTRRFAEWIGAVGQRKRPPERVRVFWIESGLQHHRSEGRRACLSSCDRIHRDVMRLVFDALVDVRLALKAFAHSLAVQGWRTLPVISVDLLADVPAEHWDEITRLMTREHARRSSLQPTKTPVDPYPRLVIAGPAHQRKAFQDRLGELIEVTAVHHSGRDGERNPRLPQSEAGHRLADEHIFDRGMPTTSATLFGRDSELDALRQAWASGKTRIIAFVASGGTGKSALINTWLREMEEDGYRGASKVLAWSFYSQGTRDDLVSADPFINNALLWLDKKESAGITLSPSENGARLASLIKAEQRFLLVLDGLEPLQYPLGSTVGGSFTDDSIRALLESLSELGWRGMCLVTTRVPLTDLGMRRQGSLATFDERVLDNIEGRAAADLLEHLGVSGSSDQRYGVAASVGRHALAVTLLGNYLREWHRGDPNGHADLERLMDDVQEGGHARRIMASYVKQLNKHNRLAELAVLDVIGLFDRPATREALDALLSSTDPNLFTPTLGHVGDTRWDTCVERLRDMGLLNREMASMPGAIDAHPLVREYFRDRLQNMSSDRWTEGNRTLFGHYQSRVEPQPHGVNGMKHLYSAVAHGTAADQHQQVFDDVLLERIWRDRRTNYSTRILGMTGSDLAALSNYFERRWTKLRDVGLSARARVLLMTNAGVRLRQLGRIEDARGCFGAVVVEIDEHNASPDELDDATYAASQNAELLVIAGRLRGEDDSALSNAETAVRYAGRGDDPYFKMHARSTLAEVYAMLGEPDEAGKWFAEARQIDQVSRPKPPFLYSQSLYRYGYYLIESGRADELLRDAADNPDWGLHGQDSSRLSKAIRRLILSAAARSLMEAGHRDPVFMRETEDRLDRALVAFRDAGYADYTVRGRIEKIHFHRVRGDTEDYLKVQEQVMHAEWEARRGEMDLLKLDVRLQSAACELKYLPMRSRSERRQRVDDLRKRISTIDETIEEFDYGRRRPMAHRLKETLETFDER